MRVYQTSYAITAAPIACKAWHVPVWPFCAVKCNRVRCCSARAITAAPSGMQGLSCACVTFLCSQVQWCALLFSPRHHIYPMACRAWHEPVWPFCAAKCNDVRCCSACAITAAPMACRAWRGLYGFSVQPSAMVCAALFSPRHHSCSHGMQGLARACVALLCSQVQWRALLFSPRHHSCSHGIQGLAHKQ